MGKVILFYLYTPIAYPKQIQKWQQRLCVSLGLTGRVLIAHEGINATLGGTEEALEQYKIELLAHELFGAVDVKESAGSAAAFPRLAVLVKKEIVHLGIDPDQLKPGAGGRHLSPQEAHALMEQAPENLVILDARNNYESRIGLFEGAITPDIKNFRDFPEYIDKNLEQFRDKQVLMYCTGGVRCERASTYLKEKGIAQDVMQITGGIHRYAEEYPQGFFKGKNYVFDNRIALPVTDDIIGRCATCDVPYDTYSNCVSTSCNEQIILCPSCLEASAMTCSEHCCQQVKSGAVKVRAIPRGQRERVPASVG